MKEGLVTIVSGSHTSKLNIHESLSNSPGSHALTLFENLSQENGSSDTNRIVTVRTKFHISASTLFFSPGDNRLALNMRLISHGRGVFSLRDLRSDRCIVMDSDTNLWR